MEAKLDLWLMNMQQIVALYMNVLSLSLHRENESDHMSKQSVNHNQSIYNP